MALLSTFIGTFVLCYFVYKSQGMTLNKDNKNHDQDGEPVTDFLKIPDPAVMPTDHLTGFQFKRNGDRNPDYHAERFLGKPMQEFQESRSRFSQLDKLQRVFFEADRNNDAKISVRELTDWISKSIVKHLKTAERETEIKFRQIDINNDQYVSWAEYLASILNRPQEIEQAGDLMEDIQEASETKSSDKLIEKVEQLRGQWMLHGDDDNLLDLQDFLEFRHPETGENSLQFVVDNIINKRDLDHDGRLTLSEFLDEVPSDPAGGKIRNKDIVIRDRLTQFREYIDADHDSYATYDELLEFLTPDAESNAMAEAQQMFWFGDSNTDNFLSFPEILENIEYFTGSKLLAAEQFAHQEL